MTGALGLAFLTGMLATVNPCGFAMLPTYLAYFIGSGTEAGRKRPLLAGLRAGVAVESRIVDAPIAVKRSPVG